MSAVADPGFPRTGGVDLVGGAVDPRGGYISKNLHVKTKESGPVGGAWRAPLDPPMVSSGHQCPQTPPLSTRRTIRPIWDKTKNNDFTKTASFHMKIPGFHENRRFLSENCSNSGC